jgi:hypothetical protein
MSRKSNRVARFSGLALAGAGLAHFTIGYLAYLGGNAIRQSQTP